MKTSRFTALALCCALVLAAPGAAHANSFRELAPKWLDPSGWNNMVTGLAVDPTLPRRLYASTAYLTDPPGAVYKSLDRGATWAVITGSNNALTTMGDVALAMRGSALLAGGGTLWSGTNEGTVWTSLGVFPGHDIIDIVVDPASSSRIFIASNQVPVPRAWLDFTTTNAASWTSREIKTAESRPGSVNSIDVSSDGRVFVAANDDSGGLGGGLYYSDDYGVTWMLKYDNSPVNDVRVDRANPGRVYAVVNGNLRYSNTSGDTWISVNTPFDGRISAVTTDSMGRVFLGTYSGSDASGGVIQTAYNLLDFAPIVPGEVPEQGVWYMEMDPAGCYLHTAGPNGVARWWVASAEELYGADRYATAIAVSKAMYAAPDSAGSVVVCTGANYADAMVAGPLAVEEQAPILLAGSSALSTATLAELERVLPAGGTVYIVGGTAAVPASVGTALQSRGYIVERLGGIDRYATSALVAQEMVGADRFFIAYGGNFPDALSASAPAAMLGMPVLLTRTNELPASVRSYLSSRGPFVNAYIAGDATVVGAAVVTAIDPYVTGAMKRLSGRTRYETSLAIAQEFWPTPSVSAGVATGVAYPDALAGAVLCARRNGPLLITPATSLHAGVGTYLASGHPAKVMVFGGRSALTADVRCAIEALW
ncbi:MAG: cell wall-binding repeat-containing protein [Coriobacteriia bacterium]|nr:cell wall-binding repeat-containing protein [Coriobacteriia bacterium]